MIIQSNIEGMQAYLNFTKIDSAFSKSLNKLSTGLDIPKPGDDGGLYAAAADMENLYQEYTVGAKNVQDAAGFLDQVQTHMTEVNDLLGQMDELAQRAATGTYTTFQRREMDKSYNELTSQIKINLSNARYNGISIWNAQANRTLSVVYGEKQFLKISSQNMTTASLQITGHVSTAALAATAVSGMASGLNILDQKMAYVGAAIAGLQSKVNTINEQAMNEKSFESRINEVDFAKEMKTFTSLQVVMQASNAMVAQSNMRAQMVLQLFK